MKVEIILFEFFVIMTLNFYLLIHCSQEENPEHICKRK